MSSSRSSSRSSESTRRASTKHRASDETPRPNVRTGSCTVQWGGGITARAVLIIGAGREKVIGPRFVRLLRLITTEGSLRGASRALGMGSRHAVAWVHSAEALVGYQLVERWAGGAHGGGARLTAGGSALIATYERVDADLAERLRTAEREFIPGKRASRAGRGRAAAEPFGRQSTQAS